nr:topoisomerase DNA-binding C4 zinc finger domain-containing protein [uncultured Anaerocolumna sp.]
MADIAGRMGVSISQAQVEDIYRKLYPFTQVTDDVKQKHTIPVDSNNVTVPLEDNLVCPKCDGKLVLRTAKRGTYAGSQFYGCSNFTKCMYMKNIQ